MAGKTDSTLGARGHRAPGRQRAGRGLPAQPGAHRQHDGDARDGRCAGGRGARGARLHQAGLRALASGRRALGRQLLLHVDDVMRTGDALPRVGPQTRLGRRSARDVAQGTRHDRHRGSTGHDARRVHRRRPAPCARPPDRRAPDHDERGHDLAVQDHRPARARGRSRASDGKASHHGAARSPTSTGRLVGALNVHDLLRAGVV